MIGLLVQETQGQNARDVLLDVALTSRRDPNRRAAIPSGVGGMPEPFLLDRQDVARGPMRGRLKAGLSKTGGAGR